MDPATIAALALAIPLVAFGLVSGALQVHGMRRLRERKHVPSDESAYLRGRYRRRLTAAAVMVTIGALIAGAYLSGMERRADAFGGPKPDEPAAADGGPKPTADAARQFARFYGLYWIAVIVLAFVLVGLAVSDAWATRRYWMSVYRAMREDHQTQLRRDLAVYKQQKEQQRGTGRGGYGGRLGGERRPDG